MFGDRTYHKDSYMAHRRDWRQGLGHEGRYRRTQSPSPPVERRRPSWPVSLSPPTVARSVSYAAPSRQTQQLSPLRLSQPASTGRLNAAGSSGQSFPPVFLFSPAILRAPLVCLGGIPAMFASLLSFYLPVLPAWLSAVSPLGLVWHG